MGWFAKNTTQKQEVFQDVVEGLRRLYVKNLRQLEDAYMFHNFHSPPLDDADFDSKPMILLIGQYSTGKTTFIRYLLEEDFPGMRIGPEPTTDGFISIMQGDIENGRRQTGVVPGNALVVDKTKPFRGLSMYGNAFLSRFQASQLDNQLLNSISIIDTPGILSGEKQRVNRGYDFNKVITWFAERVDRIVLLFDAHKLDISDEFHEALRALHGHDDKVRVVLNKSDQVTTQQLMRVYGALMWSLGKVITTPEVPRVYIGSFWDQPLRYNDNRKLFEAESQDLFDDLMTLPKNCALRKLNDLIKRARLAKVHALIISNLNEQMPAVFGKDKKKAELIKHLDKTYDQISQKYNISKGDFPDLEKMKAKLQNADWTKFKQLNVQLMSRVDDMLGKQVPELMKRITHEEAQKENQEMSGGIMSTYNKNALKDNPFGAGGYGEGINAGRGEEEWVVNEKKAEYDKIFAELKPVNGKLSGDKAAPKLRESKLNRPVLRRVWQLADVDKDGFLDAEEFALAMHLIACKQIDQDLPQKLPEHLIPPGKRNVR